MRTRVASYKVKQDSVRVLVGLMLCGLFGIGSMSPAVGDRWVMKSDMPTARMALSTSVVNGRIYAIGGQITNFEVLSAVEEYNPETDSWVKRADMPTARRSLSTSAVNGKIYAIGGYRVGGIFSLVEEYDPLTDTWTQKATMPTARYGVSTCVVGDKIYAIGGAGAGNEDVSAVEMYDPATDTWTKKADMPTARFAVSVGVVEGKIYAIGGGILKNDQDTPVPIVEEYDPLTDTWTSKADMPGEEYIDTSSVLDGNIYLFGGLEGTVVAGPEGPAANAVKIVRCYDPVTDTWTRKTDMPSPRVGASASAVDGKIYLIGGSEGVPEQRADRVPLSIVEEYTPEGQPSGVSFWGKLPTKWGKVKSD
ncbi:Kelch repeat-containing protein [Candidatus Poribacteria bacterium]